MSRIGLISSGQLPDNPTEPLAVLNEELAHVPQCGCQDPGASCQIPRYGVKVLASTISVSLQAPFVRATTEQRWQQDAHVTLECDTVLVLSLLRLRF